MARLSQQEYIALVLRDGQGLFFAPGETQDTALASNPPEGSSEVPAAVHARFLAEYLVDLRFLNVERSSRGLYPWEPACCWIDEQGNASITLRPHTHISQEALLAHEIIHALRGKLWATHFEEICAYTLAARLFPGEIARWRVLLSPLFSSVYEVLAVMCWIIGCWLCAPCTFMGTLLLSMAPLAWYALRLIYRWSQWSSAYRVLASVAEQPYAWLLRLNDEDIRWVASLCTQTARSALLQRAEKEWRWCFLLHRFTDLLFFEKV